MKGRECFRAFSPLLLFSSVGFPDMTYTFVARHRGHLMPTVWASGETIGLTLAFSAFLI